MLDAGDLVHTAVLERYESDGPAGAVFAAPVDLPCYSENFATLLEEPTDVEVGLEGKLWCNPTDVPVGSRVTLLGRAAYVLSALPYDDGSGLAHLEVALSATPRAAVSRVATVSLSKPPTGEGHWDNDAEATVPDAGEVYASNLSARITSQITRTVADSVDSAEETLVVPPYLVTVDHDVNAYEGDLVRVTACPQDLSLVNRTLRVEQVVRGTSRLERDLYCSLVDVVRPE